MTKLRLLILTPRFINGDMRGGEEVARYIYNGSKEIIDTYVITSDGLDIKYQHSIFSRSLRYNLNEKILDNHILYLRSIPLVNMAAKLFLKFLQPIMPKQKGDFLRSIFEHLKVMAHGPYLPGLKRAIKSLNPDLIWGSIYPNELSIEAFYISRKIGIPFIYTPYYHYQLEEFKEPKILESMAKSETFLIACTKSEERELIKIGGKDERVKTIKLGIESKTVPLDIQILQYKRSMQLNSNFIVLAQSWSDKGILDIMKAVGEYSDSHNDVILITIGNPDKKYLNSKEEFLKTHGNLKIKDLGWVESRIKTLTFACADIFVMLSKNDAFGLSYLDALSMKVPIVAMKGTSASDIISDGIEGFLINEGDINKLKEIIELLYTNIQIKKKLGENGLKKVRECFSSEIMINNYLQTFKEIIQK